MEKGIAAPFVCTFSNNSSTILLIFRLFLCVVLHEKEKNVLCLCVSMLPRSHLEYWAESWTLLLIRFHFFLRWPRPARPQHGHSCFSLRDEGRVNLRRNLDSILNRFFLPHIQLSWNRPARSFTAVVSIVTLPWRWQLWCRPSRGKSVFNASHWTCVVWGAFTLMVHKEGRCCLNNQCSL